MGLALQDGMTLHSPQPPICKPPSPSGLLASAGENDAWKGRRAGAERRFPGCACAPKRNTENQKKKSLARAEPGSLSFLFELSIFHSQHQSEEENVHSESNWHILEKGRSAVVL